MSGGVPPSSKSRARVARISQRPDVQKAARLYTRFSGHEVDEILRAKVPAMPKVLVNIGECDFVGYTTVRDGRTEKYIHRFAHSDKPILCVAPDGSAVFLVGGRYTFTERGIVDMSDPSRKQKS